MGRKRSKPIDVTSPAVICVLGMHRSGTSLVARLTNLLGVDLGPEEDIVKAAPDNPRGFWEHPRFRELNDELLSRLGVSWDTVDVLPGSWHEDPSLDDLREQARSAIALFAGKTLWGWKDPRTCLTLPFWQPLAPPMRYVICLRNVLDVARSLEHRNGLPLDRGARLWFHYTASALEGTSCAPRICVFYEDVIANPGEQAARLRRFVTGDDRPAAIAAGDIGDAIDDELRHHRSSLADVAREPLLPDAAKSLYLMLRASTTEVLASANNGFGEILATLRGIATERGPATIISDLRTANEQLDRTLDARTRELDERTRDLDDHRHQLDERTRELADRTRDLDDQKRQLAERTQALDDRTRERDDRTRELEDRTRERDERTRELAERAADLAARLRDLEERGRQIEQHTREIGVLTARSEEYAGRVAALAADYESLSNTYKESLATNQDLGTQLQAIYNSRAWQWLTEYRRMRKSIGF